MKYGKPELIEMTGMDSLGLCGNNGSGDETSCIGDGNAATRCDGNGNNAANICSAAGNGEAAD